MWYVELSCRVLLGAVFVVAVAGKLRDVTAFIDATRRLLPPRLAGQDRTLAFGVIGTELLVLALLAHPDTIRFGFSLAGAVLAAFSVAIAAALRRGEHTPCRCLGASTAPLGGRHVVRNGLLVAIALLGVLAPSGSVTPAGACLAVVTGLAAANLIVGLDLVVELFLPYPSPRS